MHLKYYKTGSESRIRQEGYIPMNSLLLPVPVLKYVLYTLNM